MKNKSSSNPGATLESRVAELEASVANISGTLYDLIKMFQEIPDPPCPPMCGPFAEMAKQTTKKQASKKQRG